MPSLPRLSLRLLVVSTCIHAASASIVINLAADRLDDQAGLPIAAGTLIQLVNLGPDGVFNSINVQDGFATGVDRFVSGDDSVITAPFNIGSTNGDFASAAAFDLTFGDTAGAPGVLDRVFEFGRDDAGLAPGIKLGIRWFPGLTAAQFYAQGPGILTGCQRYGEFTRQANPIFGGVVWVTPANSGSVIFDPLVTADGSNGAIPGADSATAGDANHFQLGGCPEPTSALLSVLGASLALFRRRR